MSVEVHLDRGCRSELEQICVANIGELCLDGFKKIYCVRETSVCTVPHLGIEANTAVRSTA